MEPAVAVLYLFGQFFITYCIGEQAIRTSTNRHDCEASYIGYILVADWLCELQKCIKQAIDVESMVCIGSTLAEALAEIARDNQYTDYCCGYGGQVYYPSLVLIDRD